MRYLLRIGDSMKTSINQKIKEIKELTAELRKMQLAEKDVQLVVKAMWSGGKVKFIKAV